MLHGLGSQGERHWKVFAPQFVAKGHCVFTPTYGSLHGQTFINGLDDIENSAHQIAAYIDLVLAATGASKVNILAHSEGSTVGQYYLLKLGGGPKVDRWSAIGGNFYGSTFIGLSKVLDKLGLRDLAHKTFGPLVPSLFQLLEGSEFFKKLNSNGDTVPDVQYYNLVSRYDEYVVESGFMKDNNPNVHNVYLQDLCPTNRAWHFDLLKDPVVFHAVSEFFDGNADTEVGCGPFA
ncbi:hypothetical protein BGW42_008603 [Actinomortierella wolfii]|nr:hypothetical protein BGW42_008603 [Actinomortierella wolfii]